MLARLAQRTTSFLSANPVIIGVAAALIWVNGWESSYHHLMEFEVFTLLGHDFSVHGVVNEILMVLFFAIAAKEVREALLPEGALHGFRRAMLPLLATSGGILGPALVYVTLSQIFEPSLTSGWLTATATDIVFALLLAKMIYGEGNNGLHPAITFLLTIAVVDDGFGLAMIPTMYSEGVDWFRFGLVLLTAVGLPLAMRAFGVRRYWYYMAFVGAPVWLAFVWLGVEPAMALVPVIFGMPHEKSDRGYFDRREREQSDALNHLEHDIEPFMGWILLLFGFANAGVVVSNTGFATALVLTALVVGKLGGIWVMTRLGLLCGLELPEGMTRRDIPVVGAIAGIGFTVSLFVAGIAFEGVVADAAKIGALLSLFVGSFVAFFVAYNNNVGRFQNTE